MVLVNFMECNTQKLGILFLNVKIDTYPKPPK
jgi:hypothetical protein